MVSENKYKNLVYLLVVLMGVGLTLLGNYLAEGTWKSIVINIASNLVTTGVFSFFVIEQLLSRQENKNKKLLFLQEEQNRELLSEQENKNREIRQQEINVVLIDKESNERFKLPVELRRGEFTRGEILGRIGMLPMKEPSKRFSIDDLGGWPFLRKINDVLADYECKELKIICSKEEIEQFKLYKDYEDKSPIN
jgi:hypothetical protein